MVDDASSHPRRRASDRGRTHAAAAWLRENGVPVAIFVLLGIIVLGEAADFIDDREQARRDRQAACIIGNLSESTAESVRRLREQAPVLEAARVLIAADDPAEEAAAVAMLRGTDIPRFDPDDLAKVRDCG
jgi:4-amino-4-deoxy-L-arabinose transferase-like glycosyltransferase